MKFFKKFKRSKPVFQISYEEKKYPFVVKFLVFLLACLLLTLGEYALSDVRDGIEKPQYSGYPERQEAQQYYEENLSSLVDSKYALRKEINILRNNYDTSVFERIANTEDSLFGSQQDILKRYKSLETQLEAVNQDIDRLQPEYDRLNAIANDVYAEKMRHYEIKVFFWQMIFWLPLLLLCIAWQVYLKRKDSKWSIIATAGVIASGIIAFRCICVFVWSWLPRSFFEWLWEILQATVLTRVVAYYLMVGIALFIMGGCIVLLLRFMSNPVRHGFKRIAKKECPKCSYPLSLSENYCGSCGKELQHTCSSCKKKHYVWEGYCTLCGVLQADEVDS